VIALLQPDRRALSLLQTGLQFTNINPQQQQHQQDVHERLLRESMDNTLRQQLGHSHRARLCQFGGSDTLCINERWKLCLLRLSILVWTQVAELANHLALASTEARTTSEKIVENAQAASGESGSSDARKEVVKEIVRVVKESGLNQGAEARGAHTLTFTHNLCVVYADAPAVLYCLCCAHSSLPSLLLGRSLVHATDIEGFVNLSSALIRTLFKDNDAEAEDLLVSLGEGTAKSASSETGTTIHARYNA